MVITAEKFYTTRQAAQLLGISRQTLWVWIRKGRIKPSATLGGHCRFTLDDINQIRKEMGLHPLGEPIEDKP